MAKFTNNTFISLANLQSTLTKLATKLDERYIKQSEINALIQAGMKPTYETLTAAASALAGLDQIIGADDTKGLRKLIKDAQADATKALNTLGSIPQNTTVAAELSNLSSVIGSGFSSTSTISDAITNLQAAVGTTSEGSNVSARISALETKVGTDTDKVAAAQSTATTNATEINTLKTTVGNSTSGLVKKVTDLETSRIKSVTGSSYITASTTNNQVTIDASLDIKDAVTGWKTFIASSTMDLDSTNYVDTLKEIQEYITADNQISQDYLTVKSAVNDATTGLSATRSTLDGLITTVEDLTTGLSATNTLATTANTSIGDISKLSSNNFTSTDISSALIELKGNIDSASNSAIKSVSANDTYIEVSTTNGAVTISSKAALGNLRTDIDSITFATDSELEQAINAMYVE